MNSERSFISYNLNPHIKALHLDVEPSADIEYIKKSDKPFIAWNYFSNKELFDYFYSTGKEAYCVERGALPSTIFIDGNGFNCLSSSYDPENWDHPMSNDNRIKTQKYIKDFIDSDDTLEPQSSGFVTEEKFKELIGFNHKQIVFVPLQMNRDTVIRHFGGWVKDVHRFLETIRLLDNNDTLFLIKNHPLEENCKEESDNVKIADALHYKDCIRYADKVLTINSGVGFQSMLFQKPAIVCGESFYQHDKLNFRANSLAEMDSLIRSDLQAPDVETMERFISWLIHSFYSFVTMHKSKPELNRMVIKKVHTLRFYKQPETTMKLHVGCGHITKQGYKHQDIVEYPHIDYLSPAWAIKEEDNSFNEIYSRHFFEHLTLVEAGKTLKEWYRILAPEGMIHMIIPDLAFHCKQLLMDGDSKYMLEHGRKMSNFEHAIKSIYGWVEKTGYSPYMQHNWGYTRESIGKLLTAHKFHHIEFVPDDEININLKVYK